MDTEPTSLQEKRRAAGQKGGAVRSAAKQQAARQNGQKGGYTGVPAGGRPLIPLSQILCTCGREDGTHASQCRRYQTQKKRESRQSADRPESGTHAGRSVDGSPALTRNDSAQRQNQTA